MHTMIPTNAKHNEFPPSGRVVLAQNIYAVLLSTRGPLDGSSSDYQLMPRGQHELLHNALFGPSLPLPPQLRRLCAAQLGVAAALLLLTARCALWGQPMIGEPQSLMGCLVCYALSVLACARDRALYIRLMCIWGILSFGAVLALLRAFSRPETRARIGPAELLAPCALHAVAVVLNVLGVVAVLSDSPSGQPRRAAPRTRGLRLQRPPAKDL